MSTPLRAAKITKKIFTTPKYLAVELLLLVLLAVGGFLTFRHLPWPYAVIVPVFVFDLLFRRQVGREIDRSEASSP